MCLLSSWLYLLKSWEASPLPSVAEGFIFIC